MIAFLDGIITGLFIQFAIGPVFFYILGITIEENYLNAFTAALGATLADFIYIFLSITGVGRLLQKKSYQNRLNVISNLILILFGLFTIFHGTNFSINESNRLLPLTPFSSFISCFILTISSPLTIVFWSSIFTSKFIEKQYQKLQLYSFGFGAGIMTLIFFSVSMYFLFLIKALIPLFLVQILNWMVGLIIIFYGIKRIYRQTLLKLS